MDYRKLEKKYIDLIEEKFIPYWDVYIDEQYGGILNCISNDGNNLLSTDKFTWSQGRWLYILSKLYSMQNIFKRLDYEKIKSSMDSTFLFITKFSIYDDNRCCFLLSVDGKKKKDEKTGRYDTSIYADCFALIGISEYIKATGKREHIQKAADLADSIMRRLFIGDFLTEPYEITPGYTVHGVPMIMNNTMQVFCEMLESFGINSRKYSDFAEKQMRIILDELYDSRLHLIREYKSTDERRFSVLEDRHINPGHTLEDAWFWIEHLQRYGNLKEELPKIEEIVLSVFEKGWDKEFGGLLHYADCYGMKPEGSVQDSSYDENITQTWDMKLWWPHSEMLFLFSLLYSLTGKEIYSSLYDKCEQYAFSTFPSSENGEWIQIRNRDGSPQEKTVALPVKDPFHILRDFIKIIELCEQNSRQ